LKSTETSCAPERTWQYQDFSNFGSLKSTETSLFRGVQNGTV